MTSGLNSPRPRRRGASLVALTLLLAFAAVSADARRSSIKRRLPESRNMRPYPEQAQASSIAFFPATGAVRLAIGAEASAAAEKSYHIDNVFVLEKASFDASAVDDNSCLQFDDVRVLPFDVGSQSALPLFETFENNPWAGGVAEGWELDRACWNGELSAPRFVPEDLNGSPCSACCGSNGPTDACGPAPLRPFNCGPEPVFVDTNQRKFIFLDPEAGCTIPLCPGPGCVCPVGWETCAVDADTMDPLACCPTEESCNQPRKWPGGSIALNSAGCESAGAGEASASIVLTGLDPAKEYVVHFWWGADGLVNVSQNEELFVDVDDVIVHTLTVTKSGTGAGTVTSTPAGIACGGDCSESYPEGTDVQLTAAPAAGSTFGGWSGDCSGTGACVVTLGTDMDVTANFDAVVAERTLTVTTEGTGVGTVTSTPSGIACPGDCSQTYAEGTAVSLTATPAAGSTFAGWSGACSGMACNLTMSADRAVAATFEAEVSDCPGTLCLTGERFVVDVEWRDFQGQAGGAEPVPFRSDDSGLLWFFSANNWEMLVKVLDGCGINNRFWVFAAATTNVEYTLTVRDRQTGLAKSYTNPLGNAADSITDTDAFDLCGTRTPAVRAPAAAPEPRSTRSSSGKLAACTEGETQLCLNRSRFRVEVEWRTATGVGAGQVVPAGSDDSGLFYFFSANNWEMLVKVLDGCGLNDRYWVFAAATTDVGYTLRVTDTENGEVAEYVNPVGRAAPAITDTDAFTTCP